MNHQLLKFLSEELVKNTLEILNLYQTLLLGFISDITLTHD